MPSSMRILVIDDEPEIGEIMQHMLSSRYSHVEAVSRTDKAVDILSEKKFDLIFCDINMPGISGPDLIQKLRSEGNFTSVIFVTGDFTKETAISALRLGVVDIIEKPFNEADLLQSVQRAWLAEHRMTEYCAYKEKLKG